jgi:hypothetical protein
MQTGAFSGQKTLDEAAIEARGNELFRKGAADLVGPAGNITAGPNARHRQRAMQVRWGHWSEIERVSACRIHQMP